jgi:hypothetical protein
LLQSASCCHEKCAVCVGCPGRRSRSAAWARSRRHAVRGRADCADSQAARAAARAQPRRAYVAVSAAGRVIPRDKRSRSAYIREDGVARASTRHKRGFEGGVEVAADVRDGPAAVTECPPPRPSTNAQHRLPDRTEERYRVAARRGSPNNPVPGPAAGCKPRALRRPESGTTARSPMWLAGDCTEAPRCSATRERAASSAPRE